MRSALLSVYRRRLRFLALFLTLFLVSASEGAVLYVNTGAGGANDGSSWTNAFVSLQDALNAAVSGDEIWVAAGIYRPTTGIDRSISFVLKNDFALYGGFAGTETSREQRKWDANETVLSGNIGAPGEITDNSYHVVVADGTNSSNPVLMNCTFAENRADFGGRALHAGQSSNPVATNSIFRGNGSAFGQIQIENTATLTVAYSVTDQPGTGNITTDPVLGALADNGGSTRTHALLAGSAAVNAGTSAGAPATDQRGVARPQGAGVDIGAFEQGGATPIPVPPSSGGGGCSVGFPPWALLLLLPLSFLTRR